MSEEVVRLVFVLQDDSKVEVSASIGDSILDVARKNDIDLEGACEGSLACSTCHVILEEDMYENLPEPLEEEDDMLDFAMCLTSTSRLGCQIIVTKDMQNKVITLPKKTRNMQV